MREVMKEMPPGSTLTGTVNLMMLIDPEEHTTLSHSSPWVWEGGQLKALPSEVYSSIEVPALPDGDYQVTVEFEYLSLKPDGKPTGEQVFLALPVFGKEVDFYIDLRERTCGLSKVDSKLTAAPVSSRYVRATNTLFVSVTKSGTGASIRGGIDGMTLYSWSGLIKDLSQGMKTERPLAFGVAKGNVLIRKFEIQMLNGHLLKTK